ncbi:MAG: hypothetical protein GWN71_43470, partial [Gammaproteobacteria bacterium]|nr:hypothetical protein [Gammaproteobacteria bacterium]
MLAFEQPHARLAGWIRRDAIGGMGRVEGRCVWDLYGGVGDTAELLAEQGARVWCVDADRNAVAWGERRSSERP